MKLVRTPSLFHSRNSLLNPLSLMNPSRLFRNFVFLFSLLGLGSLAWGDRYLSLDLESQYSDWISIGENEVAEIYSFTSSQAGYRYLYYKDNNHSETIVLRDAITPNMAPLKINGPGEIRARSATGGSNYRLYCQIKISPTNLIGTTTPSKKFATVIPENSENNVSIILEQSTDLINWTTASPGVFPPSTAKRFFRVRSEEE